MKKERKIFYSDLFWLFMVSSVLGTLIEGIFCVWYYKRWETHTVAVWGPFCIIYGIGAVNFYIFSILLEKRNFIIKALVFAVSATVIELLGGELLKHCLMMKAWDYKTLPFNIDGLVCLRFTAVWGVGGLAFSLMVPLLRKILGKMRGKAWKILTVCLSIFMAINFTLTGICLVRWSKRYQGIEAKGKVDTYIDSIWDDEKMQKIFCEWHFIDG